MKSNLYINSINNLLFPLIKYKNIQILVRISEIIDYYQNNILKDNNTKKILHMHNN